MAELKKEDFSGARTIQEYGAIKAGHYRTASLVKFVIKGEQRDESFYLDYAEISDLKKVLKMLEENCGI